MIPERIKIPKVEFYITNVCNLTCEDCNRFNNLDFRGWQKWSDYEEMYKEWAQYIDIDQIVILGGEPLLNPTVLEWAYGLEKIWGKYVQILTNGTRLNHVRGLYKLVSETNNWVGISLHDQNYLPELEKDLEKFMTPPILKLTKGHPATRYGADYEFLDSNTTVTPGSGRDVNRAWIPVWIQDEFMPSAIKFLPDGRYGLHSSVPEDAHAICPIAQNKSYHFIRGKLYKCGPVALFPEFDEQHNFDISDSDRELLNSYAPLSVGDFPAKGAEFLATIDNPIPQCKFCPTKNEFKKIISIRKGLE